MWNEYVAALRAFLPSQNGLLNSRSLINIRKRDRKNLELKFWGQGVENPAFNLLSP